MAHLGDVEVGLPEQCDGALSTVGVEHLLIGGACAAQASDERARRDA
jgi:hypothetical protein